ncbi:MAG: Uma2 family endonuclease [Schwartzia sp.]|nr:Uma2 family endonuclease [Schwartzia sp. (in: firmicutes)]
MMNNLAYKDEPRAEIIRGKTVMMSPSPTIGHNTVAGNVYRIFANFLRGKRCRVFTDNVDVHLDEENTFVPDVTIVCDRSKLRADGIYGAPDLVVEVLSPSTATRDKGTKKAVYERAGVLEYWIVDPLAKSIDVYHLRENRLELDYSYVEFPDWEWARMTEKERAEARLSVKISLYDDLVVDVREVFEDMDI